MIKKPQDNRKTVLLCMRLKQKMHLVDCYDWYTNDTLMTCTYEMFYHRPQEFRYAFAKLMRMLGDSLTMRVRLTKDVEIYPSLTYKSGKVINVVQSQNVLRILGYNHVKLKDDEWEPVWDMIELDKIRRG